MIVRRCLPVGSRVHDNSRNGILECLNHMSILCRQPHGPVVTTSRERKNSSDGPEWRIARRRCSPASSFVRWIDSAEVRKGGEDDQPSNGSRANTFNYERYLVPTMDKHSDASTTVGSILGNWVLRRLVPPDLHTFRSML